MTTKTEKSQQYRLLVRFPPELEQWLREEARRQDRTKQWIIEHALGQYRSRIDAGRKTRE